MRKSNIFIHLISTLILCTSEVGESPNISIQTDEDISIVYSIKQ